MQNRTSRRDFMALGLSLPAAALIPTRGAGRLAASGPVGPQRLMNLPPNLRGRLGHVRQDLLRMLEAVLNMGIAPPTVGGHARMLRRAHNAILAGRVRGARSLLGVVLAHARQQARSGLLGQDQTDALRMALSHILQEAPGWQFDKFGGMKPVSQREFEHALQELRSRGRKHHPDSYAFAPDSMLDEELAGCSPLLVGEETPTCPSTTDQQVWMICTDLMITLANVLHEIPFVGWFLASLVEIMWPESNEDPWCAIHQAVENLIDQKIDAEVKARNDQILVGLKDVVNDYLETSDPQYGNPGWMISSNWDDAESAFLENTPMFQEKGWELLLLTDYAQCINMYLGVLRDGILYGESWGWPAATVALKAEKMAKLITDATAYVTEWYNYGLNHLVLPTSDRHQNVVQWNYKNNYIRTMTVGALDYMAMWPYMNPVAYPDPVEVKLTREIYSDVQGTHDINIGSPLPVDTSVKLPLTNLTVWGWDRIDAMKVAYGGVWGSRMGNSTGGSSSPPEGINTAVGTGSVHGPLMVAYGRSGDILDAAGFKFSDNFDTGMMGGRAGGGNAFTWSFQDEIVSKIQILGMAGYPYNSADCIVYGFRYANGY